MLSESFKTRLPGLTADFAIARPMRHAVIDDFFAPEFAQQLLSEFPSVDDPSQLPNEFGAPNLKAVTENVVAISASYRALDQLIKSREFLSRIEELTGIGGLKHDDSYFGGGAHEEFVGYECDPHCDFNCHPRTGQHHRLTLVFYLNRTWNPAWGGAMRFHSNAWDLDNDEITDIEPLFNRCVVFEATESSWHSVAPVCAPADDPNTSRKSFLIHLYTNSRPSEEIVPRHGTIHVQGALPKSFKPGAVVTQEMYREIKRNVSRRHNFLRQLYKREYEASSKMASLERQLAKWKAASNVPLSGPVILREVEEPRFPDGWMSHRLRCMVELTAPTRRLVVHGYCPETAVQGRVVTVTLGGAKTVRIVKPGIFELPLVLGLMAAGPATLEITSNAQRSSNPDDVRELSFVLTKVVFE